MVEDKTINRVVTWLAREVRTNYSTMDRLARKYRLDITSDNWQENLANAMFQLNCEGVNARYGKGQAEECRPLNFTYKTEPYFPLVQVLKSLQCWHYQCCEGDVPETNLYKFFEEVENYCNYSASVPLWDKSPKGVEYKARIW